MIDVAVTQYYHTMKMQEIRNFTSVSCLLRLLIPGDLTGCVFGNNQYAMYCCYVAITLSSPLFIAPTQNL